MRAWPCRVLIRHRNTAGQQQNNDDAYLNTLDKQHGGSGNGRGGKTAGGGGGGGGGSSGGQPYYQKSRFASERVFSIRHFAGLVPYTVAGLIDKNKDALVLDLKELLQVCATRCDAMRCAWMQVEEAPLALSHKL
jgi:hypothetical protein